MTKTLSVVEFGTQLIESGDLDPIYIMLVVARKKRLLTEVQLRRWCLAYWMFYHAGVATAMSEAPDFWGAVKTQVAIPSGTRGTERRHFRGQKAVDAVNALAAEYTVPEDAVYFLIPPKDQRTFAEVSRRVQQWPMFGPWIAFKIADMIENVLGISLDWTDCQLAFYDDPLKGGCIVDWINEWKGERPVKDGFEEIEYSWAPAAKRDALRNSIAYLEIKLGRLKAPPLYKRNIALPEIESVLCKYKSYLNGRYPPGKDTREIYEGLTHGAWATALTHKLAKLLPSN